jgi:uncharacterized protein YgbK (DUF1537 family)
VNRPRPTPELDILADASGYNVGSVVPALPLPQRVLLARALLLVGALLLRQEARRAAA